MSCNKYCVFVLLLLLWCPILAAQQPFTEGCIVYAVSIDTEAPPKGITRHSGTYRLYIRNRMMRKELELDNGYKHILIWDGNKRTAYSLQTTADRPYAVQLTQQDVEASSKKYRKFGLTDQQEEQISIGGYNCQPAVATYTDGTKADLCYSKEWKLSEQLMYDWFPAISFLPLSFEVKNEPGVLMHFRADYLLAAPMERSLFRVPEGYHIISNQEYKNMNR